MKLKQLLFCLLVLLDCITANAYDFDQNGIYYNITGDNTVEATYVEDGDGNADFYSGSISIPRRISKDGVTYTVTAIGDKAFNHCSDVTSVTIPNTVTSIGNDAFSGCSNLATITIPESVTSIGEDAFWLTGLTSIAIPQSVISIGKRIIAHSRVSSIIVEEGNTKYDSRENCNAIIETETNTLIVGCSNTFIPNTVTTIGECAFERCPGLINMNIPNTITSIGKSAFYNCVSLTSVTLPNTIKSIGDYMFSFCYELASVNIPNSVTSIGVQAFERCYSLTKIEIPNSVTSIGQSAFDECDNLIMVKVDIDSPLTIDENTFHNRTNATLYVPAGCKDAYEDADYWTEFHEIVEMPGVGYEFTAAVPCNDGTANLTFKVTSTRPWEVEVSASPEDIAGALTIPSSVENQGLRFAVMAVGYEAFQGRQGLVSVVLPEGLTQILDRGFNECGQLERLVLPSTLKDIYQGAFMNCTSLAEITLPSGLTKVSLATFRNTPSLKSVNLPEGITIIEYDAFRDSGLESIKFPSTLTSVGVAAFRDCHALKTIDFNGCAAEINAEAFMGTAIEDITIPSTVTLKEWNWSIFGWCSELKTARIENADQKVVSDLFKCCSKLESVVLPSVGMVRGDFFYSCTNLKSVTFLSGVPDGYEYYLKHFGNVPDYQVLFTIPDGTARTYLRYGYLNLSDKSGLPIVREMFEDEATRLVVMANELNDGDKTSLQTTISEARTKVNAAEDYLVVYNQIDVLKMAAVSYLATATLPENFDVTATITNPNLDYFCIGWHQDNIADAVGWDEGYTYTNGDITINHYLVGWRDNAENLLADGEYCQVVKQLPAGVYRLEADAATWKDGTPEGIYLFAGSNEIKIATQPESPEHFCVKFEVPTTRNVKFGIRVKGANDRCVIADNFRLFYESKAAAIPESAELKSSETDTLYLYNVDADKYLSAGHAWSTHAILDETGLPLRLTQNEETGLWQIYFWEGAADQKLLFQEELDQSEAHDQNEDTWVDYHGDHGKAWWNITQASDGTLLIQVEGAAADKYLGNDPEKQDYRIGGYNGYTYTDVNAYVSADKNVHWILFSKAACDMIIAKRKLMDAILRMEAAGMTDGATLLSTAKTVYENDEATIKEVIDITTLLNSQMGMPKLNAPIDMTALITNPRFENNTTEGWSGANVVGGRSDATSNHEQEFWNTSFNMYQTITGVPNGRYRLKWKGLTRPGSCENVYAEYKAGTDNASAVVYANDVEKTMKNWASEPGDANTGDWSQDGEYYPNTMEYARKCFDAGLYADELEVEVKDNVLTIGVKNTQLSPEHWVIFSDFELYIMENEEQMYHKLSAEDVKCVPGVPFTYNINLTNRDEVTAFQFEMTLPEGVSIYEENGQQEVQLTNRGNGHMFSCTKKGEGNTYLFSALSLQSKPFKKNSGALVRMTLQPAEGMELGDYEVKVTNVELSKPNGMQVLPFDFTTTLTVKEADPGDVNGDGMITVTDAVYVFRYVNGQVMPHFQQKAADVNGDKQISINDAVGIVNMILGTSNASLLPSAKGTEGGARVLKRLNIQKLAEARYY